MTEVEDDARRFRIVFFVDRPGTLRKFGPVLRALAERGHEVHFAFSTQPRRRERRLLLKPLLARHGNVTWGLAPKRSAADGWRSVSWVVRGLGDLARYSDPRYAGAGALRRRMAEDVLRHLGEARAIEP